MIDRILEIAKHVEHYIHTRGEKIYHDLHLGAHCTYFGAVFIEGHGVYVSAVVSPGVSITGQTWVCIKDKP